MTGPVSIEQKKAQSYAVKSCAHAGFSVKDVDTVGRTVTGFYNTFNYLDSDGDVLLMGSAKKTIKERGPISSAVAKIKHALFHDLTQLPGKIVTLQEAEKDGISGIYFETKMTDTTIGNDTLKNYLEGIYDNHSIGFNYMQVEMVERDAKGWKAVIDKLVNPEDALKRNWIYIVKEINMYEGSTVAFGANKLTPYMGVKSANKDAYKLALVSRLDKLTHALKNGTQSDEMMADFEIQVLQIKQAIAELIEDLPIVKHTERPGESEHKPNEKSLINSFTQNFSIQL